MLNKNRGASAFLGRNWFAGTSAATSGRVKGIKSVVFLNSAVGGKVGNEYARPSISYDHLCRSGTVEARRSLPGVLADFGFGRISDRGAGEQGYVGLGFQFGPKRNGLQHLLWVSEPNVHQPRQRRHNHFGNNFKLGTGYHLLFCRNDVHAGWFGERLLGGNGLHGTGIHQPRTDSSADAGSDRGYVDQRELRAADRDADGHHHRLD